MRNCSGVLPLILVAGTMSASFAAPAGGHKKAREAIAAARAAKDSDQKLKAYLTMDEGSVKDEADVRAVYDEFSRLEDELKSKDSGKVTRASEHLSKVLASCQNPKHRAVIKELVDKESAGLGPGYWGPFTVKSESELQRETPPYARLRAVLAAAGKGKNEDALPALRSMRKKGGQGGKMAETAIARIGKDEDLDEFIREIKADPKSMVSLYGFGRKGTARVITEINAPQVSAEEKRRVAGQFPQYVPREDLPAIVPLLKHPERIVVEVSARTICSSLTAADEPLLLELLKNPDRAIRGPAILALDRLWDEKYLPATLDLLKREPVPFLRSSVISILKKHRVRGAEATLREAASSEPVPWVREEAQEALKSLSQ